MRRIKTRAVHWRALLLRLWLVDTTSTKVMLAIYATAVSIGLFESRGVCHLLVCEAIPYAEVWYLWACAWGVYAAIKWARTITSLLHAIKGHNPPEASPRFALAINGFGVVLCSSWTGILLVARWPYWFVACADITVALAAAWVFARTAVPVDGTRWHDGQ